MGRILIFIIIGFVIWLLLRGLLKSRHKPKDVPVKSQDMVECSVCGVHIPKAESLLQGGDVRCRDEEACAHRKV